jgi:hypothetical protein
MGVGRQGGRAAVPCMAALGSSAPPQLLCAPATHALPPTLRPPAASACLGSCTNKAQKAVFKPAFWAPGTEPQSKKSKILKGAAKAMTAKSGAKFDVTFAKPGDFSELDVCFNLPTGRNNMCGTLAEVCGGACQFVITTTKFKPEAGPKQACCITQALAPDLAIQDTYVYGDTLLSDQPYILAVDAQNIGTAPVGGGFKVAVWLSTPGSPPAKQPCNATDFTEKLYSTEEIPPGVTSTMSFVRAPAGTSPFIARAFVDPECLVPELSETNNQALSGSFVPTFSTP